MLVIAGLAILLALPSSVLRAGPPEGKGPGGGGHEEVANNNLSFPVIWAEGVAKNLPGEASMEPYLEGEWWYQWGTNGVDPNIIPASCPPDPDEGNTELNPEGLPLCDDGIPDSVDLTRDAGYPVADNPMPLVKAYLQKDVYNVWQAESFSMEDEAGEYIREVIVDRVDWGDNLESVDWYTKSMVRTEIVLFEDSLIGDEEEYSWPMLEYDMRHTDGWGIDEKHGLAATVTGEAPEAITGPGEQATVYSPCARLTIQKLLVERESLEPGDLEWVPGVGWTESDPDGDPLINASIFNEAVYEGGDGPGSYSAEINVKGRVIYGYTWNVRKLSEGTGDYRITFSFDDFGPVALNTFFIEGVTEIIRPTEEELAIATATEEEPAGGGGEAILVPAIFDGEQLIGGNLTYMDIRILERGGGGGGGGGHRR